MKSGNWLVVTFIIIFVMLLSVAGLVYYVDPWFHFHGPREGIAYYLDRGNQRYQNDGILRNMDYDCIIIGSSMVENMQTSQVDENFGVRSVKVPYLHTSFKEAGMAIDRALTLHPDTELVIWGLDYGNILMDKDDMWYSSYPNYMYDDSVINDINYIYNMRTMGFLADDLLMTIKGEPSTNFDEYSAWDDDTQRGVDAILTSYSQTERIGEEHIFSDEDRQMVEGNVTQNIIDVVNAHPNTKFNLFISPYSIYYWDSISRSGDVSRQLEAEKYMLEMLLQCENVKVYSYFCDYEMICNPENYYDYKHYAKEINAFIIQSMTDSEYKITNDNIDEYCDNEKQFYINYDYENLF